MRDRLGWTAAVLLGAAAYYGATRIGYAIAFVHGTVSAVWPPTGVALALVWLGGPRMLPAVFLGELAGDLANGSPPLVSAAFAVGSCLEAFGGWALLRALRFDARMRRVRDVFALLVVVALLSTIASATVGTAALLVDGDIGLRQAWATWHVWWLGDVTGDVVVAPLLLVAAGLRPRRPRGWRLAETVAFAATLGALGIIAHELTLGIAYLVLPVLIWAALRFRQPGAVLANAVLAGTGVIGAASATTALARVSVLERILFTQNFVTVGAVTTLVLAALTTEREHAASGLARLEANVGVLAEQRTALGQIATAIARAQSLDRVLGLAAGHAGTLLGVSRAAVVRTGDEGPTTVAAWQGPRAARPGRAQTSLDPGGQPWGYLEVVGLPPCGLGCDGAELLEQLADLAELAILSDAARRQLVAEATTDPLTGLFNQRAFRRRLADECERARRYRRPLALVLLDLDGFKAINDTCGHLEGDHLLTEVARAIRDAVRIEALPARLGGDEMAIILPECDADGAHVAAERVRRAIAAAAVTDGRSVTASAGVAELVGRAGDEDLIRCADLALYAAKRAGGDACARYEPGVDDRQPPAAFSASR